MIGRTWNQGEASYIPTLTFGSGPYPSLVDLIPSTAPAVYFEPAVKGICLSTVLVLISNRSWIVMISRTALFISRPLSSFSQHRFASSLVFLEHKGGKLNDSSLNAVTAAKQVEGDVGLTCSSVSEIKCRGWVRADVCCRLRG